MSTQESAIGQLCIQVHTDRARSLDLTHLKSECEAIARRISGICGIGCTEGEDNGPYLNIVFATDKPAESWCDLKPVLFESPVFGESLKTSCMCMCTGQNGWDDYLLLYHFDVEVVLDDVQNI